MIDATHFRSTVVFRVAIHGIRWLRHLFPWPWLGAIAALVVMDRLVYVDLPEAPPSNYSFDFFMASSTAGEAHIFFDLGRGFNVRDLARNPVTASDAPLPYRFPIPAGSIRRIRLDFLMGPGRVSIQNARVVGPAGNEIRKIRPDEFLPNNQVIRCTPEGDGVAAEAPEGVNDPYLTIKFSEPIRMPTYGDIRLLYDPSWRTGLIFGLLALAGAIVRAISLWRPAWVAATSESWRHCRTAHPGACLLVIAVGAVMVACYPVIFLGRSFVSPNVGSLLLYNGAPTVPGINSTAFESVQGADVGAMMWAHLPYSHVENRAIFHDGELPLWNRFNYAGVPLLGQGQSMLGDPLHWFVIAAGGNAWAWDVKFLVARWLFCAGAGWLAFLATRQFAVAVLLTVAAAFIGFFNYRINHPAIFGVCYAPWILVAWIALIQSRARARATIGWLLGLLVASIAVYASGTVKEATMLVVWLNAVGCAILVTAAVPLREKLRLALLAGGGCLAGLLVGAPLWLTFLETLRASLTFSDQPQVVTLPWRIIVAAFDGIFLQESFVDRPVVAPSANFLILLGVLAFLFRLDRTWRDRIALPSLLGAAGALALAYGVVPRAWILAVPMVRQIVHVQNTFSCVAIILLILPATRGLTDFLGQPPGRRVRRETIAFFAAALLLFYLFSTVDPARWWGDGQAGFGAKVQQHAYFLRTLVLMLAGWALLAAVFARVRTCGRWTAALTLLTVTALVPLFARHGHRVQSGHDDFFFRPMPRPDFLQPSPGIEWIKAQRTEPIRVMGVSYNLFPGFTGVVGVEGINGPDAIMSPAYRELALATGLADPADWRYPSTLESLTRSRPILDLLNTAFYVGNPGSPAPGADLDVTAASDFAIYESRTAWPRAFFVDAAVPADTADAVATALRSGDGRPFAALAPAMVAELRLAERSAPERTIRSAIHYRLTANRTAFDVEATGPGLVVLTETWWPDSFTAWINGTRTPVLRVNHAFKGVAVASAGLHHVEFRYEPQYFQLSLILAAVGLVGFGVLAWVWTRTCATTPPTPPPDAS